MCDLLIGAAGVRVDTATRSGIEEACVARRDRGSEDARLAAELGVVASEEVWLITEPSHVDFGKKFADDEMNDLSMTVLLDDSKGVHTHNDVYVFVERVARAELEEWKTTSRPGLPGAKSRDLRLLGNSKNSQGNSGF